MSLDALAEIFLGVVLLVLEREAKCTGAREN